MSSSTKGMMSVQRMAARRVAEGRDVTDHSECVPPPGMSVNMARVYRDKPPTQAPVVRMPGKTGHAASSAVPASVREIVGMGTKTGPAASSAVPPPAVSASAASASASAEKAKPGARNALSGAVVVTVLAGGAGAVVVL